MRVLLAFDKFKDSLTAHEACEIVATTLRRQRPDWVLVQAPLADGGEGFCEILTTAAGGELRSATATGPRGTPIACRFGLVSIDRIPPPARMALTLTAADHGTVALIEMAAASGLALVPPDERDVWQTTTAGTGELIHAAAAAGARAIVLGVGGSATNDLGLGALGALGLNVLDSHGSRIVLPSPGTWPRIARLQGSLPALPPIFIACDVANPLLGPNGAAAVYGPQKGLRASDLARLEHEAARVGLLLCTHFRQPDTLMDMAGAGAAGGIAFGLMVAANARLLPGFDFVARWLDLDAQIAAADLIVTGEGRFDDSSLQGKGPGAVAARALAGGKNVHVLAGAITSSAHASPPAGEPALTPALHLHAITPPGTPLPEALAAAPRNLAETTQRVFAADSRLVEARSAS